MNHTNSLHTYQNKAIAFIQTTKKCALFIGMGLGKTVITLTAISQLLGQRKIRKILIIAPLRVANSVWHQEIQKWQHLQHLTYSIITGSKKQRWDNLKKDVNIYITNRENVKWLSEKKLFSSFDMLVIDESSSFKNHKSQRFLCLKKFRYNYIVLLSGTPSPHSLLDLWSQVYLIDNGERLTNNFYHYRNSFFYSYNNGFNFLPYDKEKIYSTIKDVTITLATEDYLNLPDKIVTYTNIDLPDRAEYNRLKQDLTIKLRNKTISVANPAVLTNKLLQYCNGFMYGENNTYYNIHNEKIKALIDLIEDNPNENIIVAYNYKADLDLLKSSLKNAVLLQNDEKIILDWNNGNIKLLLAQPSSCGKGLNLQLGGNIIIWFSLTWNYEDYEQFNARLHRQGQTKPVIINHIIVKDSIEEVLIKSLTNKKIEQDLLLNYLK